MLEYLVVREEEIKNHETTRSLEGNIKNIKYQKGGEQPVIDPHSRSNNINNNI